jgi:hypothetical protein
MESLSLRSFLVNWVIELLVIRFRVTLFLIFSLSHLLSWRWAVLSWQSAVLSRRSTVGSGQLAVLLHKIIRVIWILFYDFLRGMVRGNRQEARPNGGKDGTRGRQMTQIRRVDAD